MLHLKGLTVVETKESDSQYDFTVTVENTVIRSQLSTLERMLGGMPETR